MNKKYTLICSLGMGGQICAQEIERKNPDTLQLKNYDYLYEQIDNFEKDTQKQSLYLSAFLSKAKAEKNHEEILNGYKNYLYAVPDNFKLIYADSMIYSAKKSGDKALIGSAYLTKGIIYYSEKKLRRALDNYIIANNYISKTNDQYLIYKVKFNIASIKYYLGFYHEAISLFKECITYFEYNNTAGYLNSLHSLGLCYTKIGNFGQCSAINEKGLKEGKRLKNNEVEPFFMHSEGINQYFKKNYATAIKNILGALPAIRKNGDFANEAVGYFYLGKSYWDLKNTQAAIMYFKKVDDIFAAKKYIRPDLRENYEMLISYYKAENNSKLQLYYVRRLLKADSLLDRKYVYLSGKIHKEYDTKQLLLEKQNIESSLEKRKHNDYILVSVIAVLFLSLLSLAYRFTRNKKLYKRKFEELMKKETKSNEKDLPIGIKDIHPETVTSILKQLEKFEKNKKFLEKDLTSIKLAVAFNSNANYLSKVIYHSRGKKFVDYINDLKVDHLIVLLKENTKMRNYTNKALAQEVGFSSTQRFANAFYSRTGMPTSYFIKELQKEHTETELDDNLTFRS
ncbi:AraC family transcriptional regulator [Flavobacterium poyangense]|uniref:AraC family transcriptional regulator n=1 Tax=Flavobacterium poyangense TaxID=2204302 RepID=UPI001424A181|nr:AraC family transcriptional regulator [Flavobacterium sp. JXAS1]